MEKVTIPNQSEDMINELKKERLFLDVLCREYTSVFCLDFSEKTLEILKLNSNANAYDLFGNDPGKKIDYISMIKKYTELYVAKECREEFSQVMELDNLKREIAGVEHFMYRYKTKPNKASQCNFEMELRRIDEHFPNLAIFAFRNIDELVKQENERLVKALEQKKLEEKVTQLNESYMQAANREAILTTLCNDYEVVYFCDLETDYLQVVKDSNPKIKVGSESKFSTVISLFKNAKNLAESSAEYVSKLDRDYLLEYFKDHQEISIQFSINNNDSDQTYMETRIVRVNTDSGFKVILGSRHIDDIVREREERNRKLNEAMHEAQLANASKTEFLQRMSHDIRTPLNGICGMIDIAEHYSDDLEKQKECRRKIKESAGLLLEMVNEVLDMNKLESGKVILEEVPFNLYETAEEVFDVIEKYANERGISVNCGGKGVTHWNVIGSPVHVKRIIMNIMSNAVKYNKDYGSIDLICKEMKGNDDSTVRIQFICRDTGIGMSEEFQKHIFEPFSQEHIEEKISYGRTGLGMSITKKLVDTMNGTIEINSVKGEGSTFIVTIPFKIADSEVVSQNNKNEESADITGMNILLVEDNELNMEIAEFILQNKKANVTKAWNGEEAVSTFKNSKPGTFDVILMDIMMPVMDGYTATENIRSLDRSDAKTIPIIAMTANAFTEDKIRAYNAGMNNHISKPISAERLLQMLAGIGKA